MPGNPPIFTNVPSATYGNTGYQAPAESAILTGVFEDLNAAFGGNLNTALATPQGQLASSMAAIIGNVNDTFIYFSQMSDPAFSQGRWQDGIARIYGITRDPALSTVVDVACGGLVGVVIPVGAIVIDVNGNQYANTLSGVIAGNGFVTLPFACTVTGPIQCPTAAITTISAASAVPGWSTVTNLEDGVIGQNTESRSQFEIRRQATVANNSAGSLASVIGAVLNVPNVIDAYATENTTSGTLTINGANLNPNSLYVAVVGGDPTAVATAIWSKKAPGCGYNGNTTITVFDQNSGYNFPPPSYQVTFETPAALPIFFTVSLVNNATVPSDAEVQVQAAIVSAFAGDDGGPRARIGSTVLASRYYSTLASLGSWVQIGNIQVGSPNNGTAALLTGSIGGGVLHVSSIIGTLSPGAFLTTGSAGGTGAIPPGTQVVSQLTGAAGGTGTYLTNNNAFSVPSEAMFAVYTDQNSTNVQINQVPTINTGNIDLDLI